MNSESLCAPGDQPEKEREGERERDRDRDRDRQTDRHRDQSSDGAKVFYSTFILSYKIAIFSRDKIKTYKLSRKHEVIHMKERGL